MSSEKPVGNQGPMGDESSNSDLESEKKEKREEEKKRIEERILRLEGRNSSLLALGLPIFLVILFLEVLVSEVLFRVWALSVDSPSRLLLLLSGVGWIPDGGFWPSIALIALQIIPIWVLTTGIALSFYYFGLRLPMSRARRDLSRIEDDELNKRRRNRKGNLEYLQWKAQRLSHETARVFLDNPERYKVASKALNRAERELERGESADLGLADYLVTSVYELINREKRELRAQRNWRLAGIAIIVVYIAALLIIAFALRSSDLPEVPVFGVPPSVAMWGAAGSLAAILYRFYREKERVQLDQEVRWLIARPVIGIIMGMLSYLAIRAGLLLLNATGLSDSPPQAERLEVYCVVAFIAGFSDKFYMRIIDLLVERTVGDTEPNKEGATPGSEIVSRATGPRAQDSEAQPNKEGATPGSEIVSGATGPKAQDSEAQPNQSDDLNSEGRAMIRDPIPWLIALTMLGMIAVAHRAYNRLRGTLRPS